MARKKITANLNGGDAITDMADLQFQVHDASDDSIIATANYAAIGSVNTPGTDSANITYTLNPTYDPGSGLLGQIILDGVDLGAIESIKIRCKDESGNESVLSASADVVNILFEDDFAGVTIDVTTNWTKVESNTSRMEYTQNDELICTGKAVGTQAVIENYLVDQNPIDLGTLQVVAFDILKGAENSNLWLVGLAEDAAPSLDGYIAIRKSNIENNIQLRTREATINGDTIEITHDIETTMQSLKMVIDSDIKIYYHNGSAWVQIGTTVVAHGYSGNWYPFISMQDSTAATNVLNIDNFVVTDADFDTLRP